MRSSRSWTLNGFCPAPGCRMPGSWLGRPAVRVADPEHSGADGRVGLDARAGDAGLAEVEIYFQVTDPKAATYEIANYVAAVEQLTVTTLRNVVGGMDLETTLTSRDKINSELRRELDEATGRWGLRVGRVELKAIDPPASIQGSMEKQMRADRDQRAAILSAEGAKQSAILTAEGERQAAVLRARGEAEAAVVRADADATAQATRARGQALAIATVFQAIHEGNPDQRLIAYKNLETLPQY